MTGHKWATVARKKLCEDRGLQKYKGWDREAFIREVLKFCAQVSMPTLFNRNLSKGGPPQRTPLR